MKLKFLNTYDIIIIAMIMFATAIYQSNYMFFTSLYNSDESLFGGNSDIVEISEHIFVIEEIFLALIVLVYLKFRNFDFSQWQFKITIKDTIVAVVLFCIPAFLMDCFLQLAWFLTPQDGLEQDVEAYTIPLNINFTTLINSLVNGSFEELFFIAICMSVSHDKLRKVLFFSLLIRISFHTYQGIYSALGIGLILGIFYFVVYQKGYKNLYGFFLSHALADVFGLGLVNFLYFQLQ